MIRTWCFHCYGLGSIPGQETKIPQTMLHGLMNEINEIKKKNHCPAMQLNTIYVSNRMKHLSIDLERSRTVGKKRYKLWLKTMERYCSQFWMLQVPKSRCWQGPAPSET